LVAAAHCSSTSSKRVSDQRDLREQETVESPTRDCQRITRLALNAEDGAVPLFVLLLTNGETFPRLFFIRLFVVQEAEDGNNDIRHVSSAVEMDRSKCVERNGRFGR